MDDEREPPDITRLLQEWQDGNGEALERLMPLVYNELHIAGVALSVTRAARTHPAGHGTGATRRTSNSPASAPPTGRIARISTGSRRS